MQKYNTSDDLLCIFNVRGHFIKGKTYKIIKAMRLKTSIICQLRAEDGIIYCIGESTLGKCFKNLNYVNNFDYAMDII
jgi:hypothetical protein